MIGKVAAVFLNRKELAEVESATSFRSNFEWLAISWLVQVFLGLGPPTLKNDFVTLGNDLFFRQRDFWRRKSGLRKTAYQFCQPLHVALGEQFRSITCLLNVAFSFLLHFTLGGVFDKGAGNVSISLSQLLPRADRCNY